MLPIALHSADALAWGLYTHVYFAQLLLWAVPLADPRFRRAVRRFPDLLLAGACLPDVSLFSGWVRSEPLAKTHQWVIAQRLLEDVRNDREAALATAAREAGANVAEAVQSAAEGAVDETLQRG